MTPYDPGSFTRLEPAQIEQDFDSYLDSRSLTPASSRGSPGTPGSIYGDLRSPGGGTDSSWLSWSEMIQSAKRHDLSCQECVASVIILQS